MRTSLFISIAFTLCLSTAHAKNLEAITNLYQQGQWKEAAQQAAALNTAPGYAKAARFLTTGAGVSPKKQRKAILEQAQAHAKKALSLDKNLADGYFELARTQGRLALFSGTLESLGLAKEMKANLDQSLKLNPKNASAYVALGLWHANLESKGFVARSATGASKKKILPSFKKAIQLEPNTIVNRLEFANALLLFGKKESAKKQLEYATTLPAKTHWEKHDLKQIQDMLKKL